MNENPSQSPMPNSGADNMPAVEPDAQTAPSSPSDPKPFTMDPLPAAGSSSTAPEAKQPETPKPEQISSVYPQLDDIKRGPTAKATKDLTVALDRTDKIGSNFSSEMVVMLMGVLSTATTLVVMYYSHNYWGSIIASAAVALTVVVLGAISYSRTQRMSLLMVVGVSAATITLCNCLNILISYNILKSMTRGLLSL